MKRTKAVSQFALAIVFLGGMSLGPSLLLGQSLALASAEGSEEAPSRGAGDVSLEVAQKAAAISRQTMSPFCPGRTLSDCPSQYAADWRRDIRQMLVEGKSAKEIQAELESRAAGNLSGIPNRGSSYALPVGLALGAGIVLFLIFARLSRAGSKDESETEGSSRDNDGSDGSDSKTSVSEASDQRLQDELDNEN